MSGLEEKIVTQGGFEDPTNDGIVPRALGFLFNSIRARSSDGTRYIIRASALEVWNEQIHDLLNPANR